MSGMQTPGFQAVAMGTTTSADASRLPHLLPTTLPSQAHSAMSKVELSAYERFAEPKEVDVLSILPNKKELGKLFKKDAKAIADALEAMSECERAGLGGVAAFRRGRY